MDQFVMSKKNKKQPKKTKKELQSLEKDLYKTTFRKEAEQIPLERLPSDEQLVLLKCINGEEPTEEEFAKLKEILVRYRKYIQKYQPAKTIKDGEQVVNIIKTEQELLDILDSPERRRLLVHLPLDGNIYEMDFEILQLEDSKAIRTLQVHLDLFKDYSDEEAKLYYKAQGGAKLTREEQHIVDKITDELNDKANEQQDEIILTFLANQLRLPESTDDYEKRKEFWRKFPFNAKFSVWLQVQDRLGLTEEADEKLFPTLEQSNGRSLFQDKQTSWNRHR